MSAVRSDLGCLLGAASCLASALLVVVGIAWMVEWVLG